LRRLPHQFRNHALAHRVAQRRPRRDHHCAQRRTQSAWLGYVKSARARSKIRHFLNTKQNEESAALGERLLSHALRDLGLALAKLPAQAWERFKRASGARSQKAVLAEIGLASACRRLSRGAWPKASRSARQPPTRDEPSRRS
jgi:(p)ppGpp synthase/HD superfamily hydrolase